MRALISQPISGKTRKELDDAKTRATNALADKGYDASYFNPEHQLGGNPALRVLAEKIARMACCQAVYFCEGWERDAQCQIEHVIALRFGLKVIEEESAQ